MISDVELFFTCPLATCMSSAHFLIGLFWGAKLYELLTYFGWQLLIGCISGEIILPFSKFFFYLFLYLKINLTGHPACLLARSGK